MNDEVCVVLFRAESRKVRKLKLLLKPAHFLDSLEMAAVTAIFTKFKVHECVIAESLGASIFTLKAVLSVYLSAKYYRFLIIWSVVKI
jgi:hypothetical protein